MKTHAGRITDKKIELIMSVLLRSGVYISAAIVLFGGIIYLFKNGSHVPHYHQFRSEPSTLRNFSQILSAAALFQSEAIIQLGLLVLLSTPVARVVFSIIGFLLEKDFLYAFFSVLVLIIILLSFVGVL